ncbi:hypothetical protein BU111_07405 [Staphylococcus xylosus]|nr:hypothetical protein [Staphylococcus xylosus]MCQ3819998.1 hypothetical protein [Staphylococcus xylosus]PTH98703.1 hypothetical protein BU099_07375 [Staphylococcus xylosus]PTI53533.1 hypothetical protein BU111_07405 [Staphylococcus xylosus]PTI55904.1 hypothetical protein BU106_00735 [Staphylococcus xylosus]
MKRNSYTLIFRLLQNALLLIRQQTTMSPINIKPIDKILSLILAVIWDVSYGKITNRRLQAKAVLAESTHKKTANKVGDFVDSLRSRQIDVSTFITLIFI